MRPHICTQVSQDIKTGSISASDPSVIPRHTKMKQRRQPHCQPVHYLTVVLLHIKVARRFLKRLNKLGSYVHTYLHKNLEKELGLDSMTITLLDVNYDGLGT